jgi:hypothetical protein
LISPWNGGFEDADGLKERISALALITEFFYPLR